jgi:alanine dehydrogenase
MRIGVPRESKDGERRVALVPAAVAALVGAGHDVRVQRDAGIGSGFEDAAYEQAGAMLVDNASAAFACTLIVKVKELQRAEWPLLQAGTTVFGFAQLGRDPALLAAVLEARIGCIAFETVRAIDGSLPLLAPMSRIAGRMVPMIAAHLLTAQHGGSGVLFPGAQGVAAANTLVLGAGQVGGEAAMLACELGSRVIVLGRSKPRLDALSARARGRLRVGEATPAAIASSIQGADVIVGAVLEPGRQSPKLVTRAMLARARTGSVLIDVGIDQGGIAETSRMTSLSSPTYVEQGIVHYCVPNIPALVPRAASLALSQAVLPAVHALARYGIDEALDADAGLRAGLQVRAGAVIHAGLASDCGAQAATTLGAGASKASVAS